jgi:YidC/Oxa1 family membrane protein insertase
VVQYYQSKQLLPNSKNARKLRDILKASSAGEQVDQSEVQAATSRSMLFFMPVLILLFTISLPSALGLYWLVGGLVAMVQQAIVLREDEEEMEALADENTSTKKRNLKDIPEAEVVSEAPAAKTTTKQKSKKNTTSKSKKAKRRKK